VSGGRGKGTLSLVSVKEDVIKILFKRREADGNRKLKKGENTTQG